MTDSKQLIEDIIWHYKRTLDVKQVVKVYKPKIDSIAIKEVLVRVPEYMKTDERNDLSEVEKFAIMENLVKMVEAYFNLSSGVIRGRRRKGIIPVARHFFCFLAFKKLRIGCKCIGRFLRRDHSTVLHSVRTLVELIENDKELNDKFWLLMEECEKFCVE